MHFVFWQNILSPHQAPFLRALAEKGHEVTVVATEAMTPDRRALGWAVPDTGRCKIILAPGPEEIRQIVEGKKRGAGSGEKRKSDLRPPSSPLLPARRSSLLAPIHVLAGARWTPLGKLATKLCIGHNRRIGILSETPDPRGLGGVARRVKYAAERFTTGRHFDFVLGMGEMGVRWFRRCGYPARRIFPFAYVTESGSQNADLRPPISDLGSPTSDFRSPRYVTIMFVGRFVPLKGVDLLLRAFAALQSPGIKLQLVGDGPEEPVLRALASTLGISNSVEWIGRKSSAEIPALMAKADVVVLSSRKDGWGAVVNEALMAGTPVICSTACGSAELIRHDWLGSVFRADDVEELARCLRFWTAKGKRPEAERARIREWSRCIEGESVANYFESIMSHIYNDAPRPTSPWREKEQSNE